MQFDKISNRVLYLIAFAFYAILFFLSKGVPYFWDSVLFSSRVPQFFYENGLNNLILPDGIDSGHPPFYSLLHAGMWKLLGQKLWVGHLLTACFSFFLAVQWIQLCRKWLPSSMVWLGLLFLFLEPTLLAQSVLTSPEIPLITFMLWALNSLLNKNYMVATIAMGLMVMTSTRGSVWLFILFLFQAYAVFKIEKVGFSIKPFLCFVLPGVVTIAWLAYHYTQTGWLGLNPNGNWAKYTANAALTDLPFNIATLAHRFFDFGRAAVAMLLILLIFRYRSSKETSLAKSFSKEQKLTWALFFFGLLVLGILSVMKSYSTHHRYYILLYLLLSISAIQLLYKLQNKRLRTLFIALCAAALVAGHGIVYPQNISQGWDSSLAFLNGISAKNKVEADMKKLGIDKSQVQAVFPFRHSNHNLYLDGDKKPYANYWDKGNEQYLLWSNVSNDFPDELIDELRSGWTEVSAHCQRNVCVELYRKP